MDALKKENLLSVALSITLISYIIYDYKKTEGIKDKYKDIEDKLAKTLTIFTEIQRRLNEAEKAKNTIISLKQEQEKMNDEIKSYRKYFSKIIKELNSEGIGMDVNFHWDKRSKKKKSSKKKKKKPETDSDDSSSSSSSSDSD